MPLKVVHKSIVDWASMLEDAETSQDWITVRHVRASMQQAAMLMMYRLDRKAAAKTDPAPPG
jgi:hypothetical protein